MKKTEKKKLLKNKIPKIKENLKKKKHLKNILQLKKEKKKKIN